MHAVSIHTPHGRCIHTLYISVFDLESNTIFKITMYLIEWHIACAEHMAHIHTRIVWIVFSISQHFPFPFRFGTFIVSNENIPVADTHPNNDDIVDTDVYAIWPDHINALTKHSANQPHLAMRMTPSSSSNNKYVVHVIVLIDFGQSFCFGCCYYLTNAVNFT